MVRLRPFETYLEVIRNSEGSKMFRTLWVDVDGQRTDITRAGELSCALYVSSVLYLFDQIGGVHARTESTVRDMLASGWQEIAEPRPGAVVAWQPKREGPDTVTPHIGFVVSATEAISNSSELGYPTAHHLTYDGSREISGMYWNEGFASGT